MPEPFVGDRHVDALLTNLSTAYIQDAADFIAPAFAPVIPVKFRSNRYVAYLKGDWFRDEAEERAPGAESAGAGFTLDNTPTYFCRKYAYHSDVTEDDQANADQPISPYEDAQQFVTQKLLIKRERLFAASYFQAGVWGTEPLCVSGVPGAGQVRQWNEAEAIPIEVIDGYKAATLEATGMEPNTLAVGYRVYNRLKNHPSVLDRIKYTQRGVVTPDLLAALFGIPKFLVGKAVVNLGPRGGGDVMTFISGNHALLAYVNPAPAIKKPSAAYIFGWTGLLGAGAFGNRIKRFELVRNGSERIEGEMAFDMKVVGADLGVFFEDVVAE